MAEMKIDISEVVNGAIEKIKHEGYTVQKWIPCSERLPEAGMPVLIYGCRHRVTAYYDNCKNLFRLTENDNLYYIAEYVTHWMPLPEPPRKEDADDT